MTGLLTLLCLLFSACGDAGTQSSEADLAADSVDIVRGADATQVPEDGTAYTTIVGVVGDNEPFSTLLIALEKSELVEVLNQPGPYTVFAPINSAFEDLPEGTLETLMDPAHQADLKNLLTYHVIAGEVSAADLLQGIDEAEDQMRLTTLQGEVLTASLKQDQVILTDAAGNTATVISADVAATNGVVHGIDQVLRLE
jgi:uncharacterized surface protein with fasciclin (FAS1) repeats